MDVTTGRTESAKTPIAGPFGALRREIDRLFDDFAFPDLSFPRMGRLLAQTQGQPWGDLWVAPPAMDFIERDTAYELRAELPGLTAADIDIRLGDGVLTIKGEKTTESEGEDVAFHMRERSHGSFQRTLSLPTGIDTDAVTARFDQGVLTLTLPKTAAAIEQERKIEITT